MRLGLVQKGNYKTLEFNDLSGYMLEVNGYVYNFTNIINATRHRIRELWQIECPPDLIQNRLHFGEEQFMNRYLRGEHYGAFNRSVGSYVGLGLLPEEETYNLVIHEVAHEIHYRDGNYNRADEILRELVAIMAESEYGIRDFPYEPHYTSQQLLLQLMELPGFGKLPFLERWKIISGVGDVIGISYLVNHYLDDRDGKQLRAWLARQCGTEEQARAILNTLATTTASYALFNRQLVIKRILQIQGLNAPNGQVVATINRSLMNLKNLDRINPGETLSNLINQAFYNL
ncbi:hypothetical protein [Candidatus Chlorohelix sp.]|uniref:hypothetical protein n=1 Tax=Candidatus Chlorohelix sp. TaxID=3139201 RepID=UPI00305D40D1